MTRVARINRLNGRQTAAASLLALVLLLGSALMGITVPGSVASAAEPGAVYYGYVVPERGMPLPKRVRAVTESGTVCASSEVAPVGTGEVGFYVLSVLSADMRQGCPEIGRIVRFVLVYGQVDEGLLAGEQSVFMPGSVQELHLIRTAAEARLALP
jgi:hypothetical protein